ncbi:MAG: tetratricopeptide repeat protein [Planctomycetota bacterium]
MSPTCLIAAALTLFVGQMPAGDAVAPPHGATAAVAAVAEADAPDSRAVLERALADFDAAVAMNADSDPEAQRMYRRALTGFETLVRSGVENGGLYYNIANTWMRLGDIGRAIANYRRALNLMPGDPDIRKNLQVARNLCQVRIQSPATSALVETLLFWHFGTSFAARLGCVVAAYVLFWMLLTLQLFVWRRAIPLTWLIRVSVMLILVVGSSVAWDVVSRRHRIDGVVLDSEVVLRKGNGEYYDPQLDRPLSEGVEFRLIESREDVGGTNWYHIRLRDGKEGWLTADQAGVI